MGRKPQGMELFLNNKLFVGGLSWGTTDKELKEAFEAYGDVTDARVIRERDSGRSRGFGFVTFENEEDAGSALEAMNDTELDGRNIRVDFAHDKR
jgi:cold-inducible RNA-binding protein